MLGFRFAFPLSVFNRALPFLLAVSMISVDHGVWRIMKAEPQEIDWRLEEYLEGSKCCQYDLTQECAIPLQATYVERIVNDMVKQCVESSRQYRGALYTGQAAPCVAVHSRQPYHVYKTSVLGSTRSIQTRPSIASCDLLQVMDVSRNDWCARTEASLGPWDLLL